MATAIYDEVHVGDVVDIIVTFLDEEGDVLDISSATIKQILLNATGRTAVARDAEFVTDGSDGKLTYTTVSGETPDLPLAGICWVQGYVSLGGSVNLHTEMDSFPIRGNLV